ncbi:hypothetical protein [Streptomyces lydicus]|uniref:hypothetical protein n=1 Tax=Streptomyces lydicus TaxID=47763 RepID=UPI0036E01195
MADYNWFEEISRRVTYTVPAPQPWGTTFAEVDKAVAAAWVRYREHHGLPEDARMPEDFCRVFPWDDEIRIVITLDKEA